jgi:tetratricopeptide (TPR) repeat protein
MFPHHKLDWSINRLERTLEKSPDDIQTREKLAITLYSKARFHEGGEPYFNRALTEARRILQHDPLYTQAKIIAGGALVGLNRLEKARASLQSVLEQSPERADFQLIWGDLLGAEGQKHQAIRSFETACRIMPEAWEPHCLLGLILKARAEDLGFPKRLLERSQFHIVKALQSAPNGPFQAHLVHAMGVCCIETGRLDDALTMFQRLQEHPIYKVKARYYLGLVAYHLGKYKNAILYFRHHLKDVPENPRVYARIGACYLHLGEVTKAREACSHALAAAPQDPQARWTLGCALVEEGRIDDASRLFRELLADVPEHLPAFTELVRMRRNERDTKWLLKALRSEISIHDRLPIETISGGRSVQPRTTTRERIRIILDALENLKLDLSKEILTAMALSTDEGLRFQLWETALDQLAASRAVEVAKWLKAPANHYGPISGREVITIAKHLPETCLTGGLQLSEEDLRRATVSRHGSTADIAKHRGNIEVERGRARAWQSLLLLAIGLQNTTSGRNLLVRWATEADEELAIAAQAALALLGDADAVQPLRQHASKHRANHLVNTLLRHVSLTQHRPSPRPISNDESLSCSCCNRRSGEVDHMIVSAGVAICDRCMTSIARERRKLQTEDPKVYCALSEVNCLQSRGIYVYNNLAVSAECVDQSLGLLEREEVDRYLATI